MDSPVSALTLRVLIKQIRLVYFIKTHYLYVMSKYAQAWAILNEFKTLTLTLDSPRVERTVRKAIIEQKKLDPNKNPLERIKVNKYIDKDSNKITLDFALVDTIRYRTEFIDLNYTGDIDDPTDII